MLMTLRRRQGRQDKPLRDARAGTTAASSDVVNLLAAQAGGVGRQAAELDALVDGLMADSAGRARAMQALAARIDDLAQANTAMSDVARTVDANIAQARAAVGQVAGSVDGVVHALREVAAAAQEITQIALQTRLVAFNASVEAQRSGEAGRGFNVVADVVKDLATKVEQSSKLIGATLTQLDRRVGELTVEISDDPAHRRQSKFHRSLAQAQAGVAEIARAGQASRPVYRLAAEQSRALAADAARTAEQLIGAREATQRVVAVSAGLAELASDSGLQTDDSRYIAAVTEAAERVSAMFREAIRTGAIEIGDLFDEAYAPIPGTDPQQHATRFVALAERALPALQEPLLQLSSVVVFCAAIDRNGYLPIRSVNLAQASVDCRVRGEQGSGNRRLLDDRVGLAAGRNDRRFLLQTYCRELADGRQVMMKDLSAPIRVDGRLWGSLRLGYLA